MRAKDRRKILLLTQTEYEAIVASGRAEEVLKRFVRLSAGRKKRTDKPTRAEYMRAWRANRKAAKLEVTSNG